MKRISVVGLAVLAMMALAACYSPEEQRDDRFEAQREVFGERFNAEETATATPDPAATADPNAPPEGVVQGVPVSEYFASLCAACHGAQRQGGVGLPLTRDRLTEPDQFYIDTIKNGRPSTAMQPYGGGAVLTDDEVATIVTWLKSTDP